MIRVLKIFIVFLIVIQLFACGGGESSSKDSDSSNEAISFSQSILENNTYYFSWDDDGTTVQVTVSFSGNQVIGIVERFSGSTSQGTETYTSTASVNNDGSLTANIEGTVATYILINEENDYFTVEASNGTETWTDSWYFETPEEWLMPAQFTTDMLDDDTYYVTELDTNNFTLQSTLVCSGTEATVTEQTFNTDGELQATNEFSLTFTLNADGTLTSTDNDGTSTYTLISQSDEYLIVHAVNGDDPGDTWTMVWARSKPADWYEEAATQFTTNMLTGNEYYFSWHDNSVTVQVAVTFTGNQVIGVVERFDSSNVSQGTESYTSAFALNDNGSLTANIEGTEATYNLVSEESDHIVVTGSEGTDTWTDSWYFDIPEGWLESF